jgi:hypothetical protein
MLLTPPLIALAASLGAGTPRIQAPDAPWNTLRTAHYVIHFPAQPDFQAFAHEVASKVEGIHGQVVAWVGYEAPGPIHILIRDPQLEANGSAWPFTDRPWVELWKTPPEPESAIGHHASWVELLVTHELAHIHHLLRPQNRPNWIDKLLGLPAGPLVLKAPRWVTEGYATVLEGKITGSGRPHSAYRASLIRQWALQGKLPDYGALSGSGGFRGGSMAYLVGSAYLEWLERQNPGDPDLLKKLWKQLASKKRRAFEPSFRATFGLSARDGYDRWRAEVTHDALELEQRAKNKNLLREGEVWSRFDGEVTDLAVSPDGSKLLARVLTKDFKGLRIWDLGAVSDPSKLEGASSKKRKAVKPDPNEVEDRKPEVPPRPAKWTLGRVDGRVPEKPGWVSLPGAKEAWIQFSIRQSNEEGALQRRLLDWHLPPPSRVEPGNPDAKVSLSAGGFEAKPDSATWDIFQTCNGKSGPVTRTLSAALKPAPTPDGKWLFYTQLTASGLEIRKLDLSLPPLEDGSLFADSKPLTPDTVRSRDDEPSRLPAPVQVPEATAYRVTDSLWNRGRTGVSVGPAGESLQLGYGGTDLLGRFSWLALASLGNGAGPRGATAAAVWHGWRWAPSLALFSSLERPSAQKVAPVAGIDAERRGAELAFTYESKTRTPTTVRPFLAGERVENLESRTSVNRAFAGLTFGRAHRWLKGEHVSFTLNGSVSAASGRTDGEGWNLQRGQLSLRSANDLLPLCLKGELARVGGRPSALDRLSLGNRETSLVPAALDLNRIHQSALPAHLATGDRARRWRGELGSGLRAYLEHAQVWNSGQARAKATRVAGVELAFHELLPVEQAAALLGRIELTLGLHRPLDGVMKDRTVGTVSLIVRP